MLRAAKWRFVATLAACQALMTTVIAMTQSLVSIEARSLAGGESLSGSGLAAQLAGAILALIAAQRMMGQRRHGLVLGAGFGGSGRSGSGRRNRRKIAAAVSRRQCNLWGGRSNCAALALAASVACARRAGAVGGAGTMAGCPARHRTRPY